MNESEAIEVLRAAIQGIHAIIGPTETGKAALSATANLAPSGKPQADLTPVIQWLEGGCDPKRAAHELRLIQDGKAHGLLTSAPAVRIPGERDGR